MTASARAMVCDLLGYDPDAPIRQSVAEALATCRPGEVVAADDGGRHVAVVVLGDGRAFAVTDRCPHDGGLLSDGFLDGDRLVCGRHQWEVDPCTGRCDRRPGAVLDVRSLLR